MKVEVEIPNGKYCLDCIFNEESWPDEDRCIYNDEYLKRERAGVGYYIYRVIKHPDCPSLKEKK